MVLGEVFLITERGHETGSVKRYLGVPGICFTFFPRRSFYLCRWLFSQRLHLPASLAARYGPVAKL